MTDTTEYIAELDREIKMLEKIYPGLVKAGKMSQANAEKKIELIRGIAALFRAAQSFDLQPIEIRLPFYEHNGSPFPFTTLEPHIREIDNRRNNLYTRAKRLTGASREYAIRNLRLIREILDILRYIQSESINKSTQTKLF